MKNTLKAILSALMIVPLLACPGFLHAQAVTGAIVGHVTDPTGAAIPGAKVIVTNQVTNVSMTLTTNSEGYYYAEGLGVGEFSVTVSARGFEQNVTRDIKLNPGERRANNVVLPVGKVTASVTVSANALAVNTQTPATGGTIDSKQMKNLVLNGRNFQTLAVAIPGVSSFNGVDSMPGGGTPNELIINGTSVDYTNYTIDGVYDLDGAIGGFTTITPPVDAIAEFSVVSGTYSAKYSGAGGGQVVIVTKSGTSEFHGSAWDYIRNNTFDAANYFSTQSPHLRQNIFGYTLGGPVIIPGLYDGRNGKKKTFFFASNQWYRIRTAVLLQSAVFTQAMRNGDFSSSPTLSGPLMLDAHSEQLLANEGKTNCILGPTTINPTCFDPVAVALLNAYVPLPNNPSGGFLNYINQTTQSTNQTSYQYRVDHYFNSKNLFTVRINYEDILSSYPYDNWDGIPFNTITDQASRPSSNMMARWQSTITPDFMNSLGVGYNSGDTFLTVTKGGTLPSGVSITQAFPGADKLNRIPEISIGDGWFGLGVGGEPIISKVWELQFFDDASWVRGSHIIEFGGLYFDNNKIQNTFTTPEGGFSFSGIHTGDPAADYMLGLDSSYYQNNNQKTGGFRAKQVEIYAQDHWTATPRLVLTYGVRWQHDIPDTADGNEVTNFNPALYDPTQAPVVNINGSLQINSQNQPVTSTGAPANLLNGLEFAGMNGVSDRFYHTPLTDFGPRFGFAYDVFGNGKTSVRGGIGTGFHTLAFTIYNNWGQNPPYNQSANIENSLLSNGTAGTAQAPTTQSLDLVPVHNQDMSRITSYSLTVEQQVARNLIASIGYAGSQGRHMYGSQDRNFPLPVSVPSTSGCLAVGQASSSSYQFDPCINTHAAAADYTRPYKGYSSMSLLYYDEGSLNYNSLQSGIRYRKGGSQFTLSYTYQKTLTTIPDGSFHPFNTRSSGSGAQNPRNFHAEYGPPSYDFTNNIAATWVYQLPFFNHDNGLLSSVLGHWTFTGLALHRSGFALSPGLTGATRGLATRPNQVHPVHTVGKLHEWFDTSAFARPEYGFFGNASNGTIRGPAYNSFNVALDKTFPIVRTLNMELSAEAFNVANHPNYEGVATTYGAGNFGHVISAGDPRIMEFAVKMHF